MLRAPHAISPFDGASIPRSSAIHDLEQNHKFGQWDGACRKPKTKWDLTALCSMRREESWRVHSQQMEMKLFIFYDDWVSSLNQMK